MLDMSREEIFLCEIAMSIGGGNVNLEVGWGGLVTTVFWAGQQWCCWRMGVTFLCRLCVIVKYKFNKIDSTAL